MDESEKDLCQRHSRREIVNVSHDDLDGELSRIQRKLQKENAITVVDDRTGVQLFLQSYAACTQRRDGQTIDLIAHSTAIGHVLLFDGWKITRDVVLDGFCKWAIPHLDGIKTVRLIGCGTASTSTGIRAMALLTCRAHANSRPPARLRHRPR